jgi:hypothetical protein
MKRIKWSDEEKTTLKKLYDVYGEFYFAHVSKFIPWRKTKDARQVWKYHFKSDVKKTAFSVEEQMKIKNLREKWIRWSEMEKQFNVRDQIRLRNEYRKIKRQERSKQVFDQAKMKKYQEKKKKRKRKKRKRKKRKRKKRKRKGKEKKEKEGKKCKPLKQSIHH